MTYLDKSVPAYFLANAGIEATQIAVDATWNHQQQPLTLQHPTLCAVLLTDVVSLHRQAHR